jgi:predicted alpha/beta-hydrolase family hydrolase
MKTTSFQHFHNSQSNQLDIISHGGGLDITSDFIQKIIAKCINQKHSVFAFNSFYIEEKTKIDLQKEVQLIYYYWDYLTERENSKDLKIRLIGKSAGAILFSHFLQNLNINFKNQVEFVIYGCVPEEIQLQGLTNRITIIQGQKDRFGSGEMLKTKLQTINLPNLKIIEIPNADHSYRDQNGLNKYHELAISYL